MNEFGVVGTVISTMTLSMLTLEFGKLLFRRLILKDPTYDFPSWVYMVFPPVLNILWVVPLAALGFEEFPMPVDWLAWVRSIVIVLVASLGTLAEYTLTIRPLKVYGVARKLEQNKTE